MRLSSAFLGTRAHTPDDIKSISHDYSLRSGLISKISSGSYSILPLGKRVVNNIEDIVKQSMNDVGGQEISLPAMQPKELWMRSNRWEAFESEMIKFEDRSASEYCLGPTHEEAMVDTVQNSMQSYNDLPVFFYQVGTKFRDEIRPRKGLIRAKEFSMKDGYSFHEDKRGLEEFYARMKETYEDMFNQMGLNVETIQADNEEMGGKSSEEFIARSNVQNMSYEEDIVEVGHIFSLGDEYSRALDMSMASQNGQFYPEMGCYGVGITRSMAGIIEQHNDSEGIIWPKNVAPYDVGIVQIGDDKNVENFTNSLYQTLQEDYDVVLDDRDVSPGVKFTDADIIGLPVRVVSSQNNLSDNEVEVQNRRTKQTLYMSEDSFKANFDDFYSDTIV